MKGNSSFFEHYIELRVEGFALQRLLNDCTAKGILLREIRMKGDMDMTLKIMGWDYDRFLKLTRNRYRITILKEKGCKPLFRRILRKKSTIVGLIIFLLLMYYQSAFISEIRIYGYEKFTETQVRKSLKEAGFYEGCSKNIDVDSVKLHLYNDLPDLAWVGISYKGNLAEVTIAEGTKPTKKTDDSKPANIVATKDGYVEKITAKDGFATVSEGAFVKKGDVVISGTVPIQSTSYDNPTGSAVERYVHAKGEVQAKVPYRFNYYQPRYDIIKKPTGKKMYGIHLDIGNFKFNTINHFNQWESSVYKEKQVFQTVRPIPIRLAIGTCEEVTLSQKERSEDTIKKTAESLQRKAIKEKVGEKGQILNKSLKFSAEENIIEVAIMLEVLEQIGEEEEFAVEQPAN